MTQKQIDRINELGRKSRTPEGLSDAEREEQAALRQAYIAWYRAALRGQPAPGTTAVRADAEQDER